MTGDFLISWSVRLGVLLFFAVLILRAILRKPEARGGALYWLWLVSFLLFVVHVTAAFHFKHGWSHAAAFDDTARQTQDLIGIPLGLGVYFNYLFLALWALDLVLDRSRSRAPSGWRSWIRMGGLAYLLFIVFNGTVVFKTGGMRVFGLVLSAVLLACILFRALRHSQSDRQVIRR